MVDSLQGVWRLQSSHNFEELMASFGVGLIMRKLAVHVVPILTVMKDGNRWEIRTEFWSNSWITKFEIGKEFDEKLLNGQKGRFVCTIEDEFLIQRQVDSKNPINITRWTDELMLVTRIEYKDVVCFRRYSKANASDLNYIL